MTYLPSTSFAGGLPAGWNVLGSAATPVSGGCIYVASEADNGIIETDALNSYAFDTPSDDGSVSFTLSCDTFEGYDRFIWTTGPISVEVLTGGGTPHIDPTISISFPHDGTSYSIPWPGSITYTATFASGLPIAIIDGVSYSAATPVFGPIRGPVGIGIDVHPPSPGAYPPATSTFTLSGMNIVAWIPPEPDVSEGLWVRQGGVWVFAESNVRQGGVFVDAEPWLR